MGEVWRATDTKLNRDVAIKVLPDSLADDPDRLARFAREAQVLAALNHPNIAGIYGVEERAIVMELVEGQSPAGPMSTERALPIIGQLLDALEYAHEKGVVHRDLKPANLKITPEGRLKVLDFGLAKALSSEPALADPKSSPTLTMRATMAGAIMGTAAYMAPEQARGQNVDKRADIWAFGVIVYELLTGTALFEAPTVSDTLAAVLTRPIDLTLVPERFRPLLRRCLERDQRQRLRDIGDAAMLLQETPSITALPAGRDRRGLTALAIGATLAACTFAWLWMGKPAAQNVPYRFTLDTTGAIHFSPNGRWMVNFNDGLRVRSLDGVEWRFLPGTEGASDPFWSPDSSSVGFFSEGRLRSIAIDGTNARNLAPAPEARGGSWRGGVSDGTILFASARSLQTLDLRSGKVQPLPLRFAENESASMPVCCPESDSFVYLLSSSGKRALFRSSPAATEGIKVLDTGYAVTFARHPHTGKWHLFYVRREATPGIANRTLMTAPVDPKTGAPASEPASLVDAMSNWVSTRYASFDVGANGIIYWRNTTPALPIWRLRWFDRNGNVTGAVGDAAGYASMALSPDETRVAALQGYPDQHIWVYHLQTGAGVRISRQVGSDGNPVWSPDGKSLYFTLQTDTGTRVIRQPIEPGSAAEVIYAASSPALLMLQAVTPDNRYLILFQGSGAGEEPGNTRIVQLDLSQPAETRQPEMLLSSIPASVVRLAPDGRSLVLGSSNGQLSACRYPPAGDSPRAIGAFPRPVWPFFSRDSRTLYVFSGQALYSHPVETLPGGGIRLGERSLLFRVMHPARADSNMGAASRDGSRIMAISTDAVEETRLQLLTDWTTLLRP